MSDYKLIAFDMDGTLLDSNKTIRQDSLDAIKEAVDAGKYVALSTGRSYIELKEYLPQLSNVHFVIGTSGATLFTNPELKELYSKSIEPEIVTTLFERTSKFDLMWHIHSAQAYTQINQVKYLEDYQMGIYRYLFDKLPNKVDNLPEFYKTHKMPVYKFNCYCKTPRDRELVKSRIKDLPINMAYSETTSLEISPKGISKASGLRKICNNLSISEAQAIVVGDGDNDLEILGEAGLAVGMGNANKSVLDIVDVVVSTNDEGGCAEAIRKYLL